MSDDFKLQASIKVPHGPDNYRDSMINVRADTVEEFGHLLTQLEQNAANLAGSLQTIHASANVAASFPGSQNVQQDAGAGNYANSPGAPAQQYQPQQPAAPQGGGGGAPAGPAPVCAHGPMQYREAKPGSGKNWKAWFCPTPKGTPDQCKAQFL